MFGSRISRRTVKSVNFLTRKQYFSSLLGYLSERREEAIAMRCILDLASDTAQRLTDNPP